MGVAYPSFLKKMHHKFKIALLFVFISGFCLSQTIYGGMAPDSIRKKCEAVIISEIGNTVFKNNVKFIKSDAHTKEKVLNSYTLFYSFTFPNVKESHVVFTMEYNLSGNKSGVIKDIAYKNHTRLPSDLKKTGAKIISYNDAKKTALATDTSLKKFENKLYGELSTEYDNIKKDYYFVWYFYYMEPCKNCEAEMYTTHNVFINASNGKVISTGKK